MRRALDRLPRSASLWHDYGLALERQGRRSEARDAYRTSLEADPGMAASQGALGALVLQEGDLDQAERLLESAYRGGERGAQVLTARASLFERQGKGRDAANSWGEAILAAPARRTVLLEAARFHVRRAEPGPALALFTRLLQADPGDSAAAVEKALLLESLGRSAEARDLLRSPGALAEARIAAGPAEAEPPEEGWVGAGAAESGGPSRPDDLRLLEVAARLEEKAGDKERARLLRQAMVKAGGGGGS